MSSSGDHDPSFRSGTIRYDRIPERNFEFAPGDEAVIRQIGAHIVRHLGTPTTVYHEVISDAVHVDIHILEPTADRPYYTLVTSGMSERAMNVPPEANAPAHLELVLCLPASWPMDQKSWEDPKHYWPIGLLKFLARFPHVMNSWLGLGHTFPNGEDARPYTPETRLCCALLGPSVTTPQEFWALTLSDGRTIGFLGLYFITADELAFKLQHGGEALHERLLAANVTELVQPARQSVLAGAFAPAPHDVVGTSFASSPGHVPVRLRTLFKHMPPFWQYPAGMVVVLALGIGLGVAFLAVGLLAIPVVLFLGWRCVGLWRLARRLQTWFQCGNALPGQVVRLDPLCVAVLANLTNDGSAPYHVVKIEKQPIRAPDIPGVAVGTRVATVCTYASPPADAAGAQCARWSDVTPWVVNLVNDEPATLARVLQTFEEEEWAELQRALDQVPAGNPPGLYPVDLSLARPAPAPVAGRLRIAGRTEVPDPTLWSVIGGDGQEYGPYTAEQLQQWVQQGLVNAQSLARKAEQGDWQPLASYPETSGWFRT
jgi:hypothetical protein